MTKNSKRQTEWTPEPFPEPRTIPEKWDSTALSEKKKNAQPENMEDDWKPESFPEPRMFPWDSGR